MSTRGDHDPYPVDDSMSGSPFGPPGVDRQRQMRTFIRVGLVNGTLLLGAALVFVFAPIDPQIALWVLVITALATGINLAVAVARYRSSQTRAVPWADAVGRTRSGSGVEPTDVAGGFGDDVVGPTSYADLPPLPGPPTSASPFTTSYPGELVFDVEDVFTITGRGTVVTGMVAAGTVRVGDAVRVVRAGRDVARAEVLGVEMFRRTSQEASVGDRAGLLLSGVRRDQIAQGDLVTR